MQRIVILRHATAAHQGHEPGDRARPLSARGRAEMPAVRRWMDEQGVLPDAVVCSSAERTRETLDLLELETSSGLSDQLYLGSPETYLEEAELTGGETVLLVGHNPTCAALVAGFQRSNHGFVGAYPPASICVAERFGESWRIEKLRLGGSEADV